MYGSQLFLVLKSLDEKEQSQFDRFLHSPYFFRKAPSKELLHLWQYLRQGVEDEDVAYFERERVYGILFPEQPVIKSKLEKLMSELLQELKRFLLFEQVANQPADERDRLICWMTQANDRRLEKFFRQLHQKSKKLDSQTWGAAHFYKQFLLEGQISRYESLYNNRETDLNLPQTHHYLDLYYLVQKLEYTFQLLARDLFIFPVENKESLGFLDTLIPALPKVYLEVPIVQLYLEAYYLLQYFYEEKGHVHYLNFQRLLEEQGADIPYQPLAALQTLHRSYVVAQYRKAPGLYLSPLFDLYQQHLSAGYLYQNDQIFPGTMANLVQVGLRSKAFDWVHCFLLNHKDRIGGTLHPEVVFQYNLGQYYFGIKAYDQALDSISSTYNDPFYKVAARRLEV
ncbi:MAG: hypothetical protein AAF985_27165 [Bacteroidota bacterium]